MLTEVIVDLLVPESPRNSTVDFCTGRIEVEDYRPALDCRVGRVHVGHDRQRAGGVVPLRHISQAPGCGGPGEQLGGGGICQGRDQFRTNPILEQVFGIVEDNRLTTVAIAVAVELEGGQLAALVQPVRASTEGYSHSLRFPGPWPANDPQKGIATFRKVGEVGAELLVGPEVSGPAWDLACSAHCVLSLRLETNVLRLTNPVLCGWSCTNGQRSRPEGRCV